MYFNTHITPILFIMLISVLGGCSDEQGGADVDTLEVWAHAGQASERRVLEDQVARFNAQQHGELQVRLTLIPEGSYNEQVQAAAMAGDLPDLLEFDGPFLYAYVWQGRLRSLDDLVSQSLLDDLLPPSLRRAVTMIACGPWGASIRGSDCMPTGNAWRRSVRASPAWNVPGAQMSSMVC